MDRVHVLVVDDQRRVREGLKPLLTASAAGTPTHQVEIQVLGQAESGLEAVRLIAFVVQTQAMPTQPFRALAREFH